MDKILTISIAAYNAEKDIARCLDSLVRSRILKQLDIIIINDGSIDGTENAARKYVEKYPGSIRLVNKSNGGHGSTINASIQLAAGKYYKILDSDDWVDSENLERLVRYLRENETDMVLNPYCEVSFSNHKTIKLMNPNGAGIECEVKHGLDELDSSIILYMHSLTFKTQIIKKMGAVIDENCFYVDMEYSIFPLLYVKSFSCLSYPVYQYLIGSQNQSMNMENLIKRREQHLKVIKRLVKYYNENVGCMHPLVCDIIALRIKYAVYQQYKIYLHMLPEEGYAEVKEFDVWLKRQGEEIYDGPKGKIMMFIRFNRGTNYKMFRLLLKMSSVFMNFRR